MGTPGKSLRILVLIDYYTPAYRFGGPITTVASVVAKLGAEFEFVIVTRDRDCEDTQPFSCVNGDSWLQVGKAVVRYLSPKQTSISGMRRILRELDCDIVYLNSLFSIYFTIVPLLLMQFRLAPRRPVVLAPRGMFSPGALQLKYLKKCIFLRAAHILGLFSNVTWQATSDLEREHIQRWFPSADKSGLRGSQVVIACDLSSVSLPASCSATRQKTPGSLRVVFLSRITEKKNLDYALRLLPGVRGEILFDIYGPIDRDKDYWEECKRLMLDLPDNVKAEYKGIVSPDKVVQTFAGYHVFLFPTRGENFGHVIVEAMAAGCLVLLSDQTPWRGLAQKKVGWDCPLDDSSGSTAALQEVANMDADEFTVRSQCAMRYASEITNDSTIVEQNRRLFLDVGIKARS